MRSVTSPMRNWPILTAGDERSAIVNWKPGYRAPPKDSSQTGPDAPACPLVGVRQGLQPSGSELSCYSFACPSARKFGLDSARASSELFLVNASTVDVLARTANKVCAYLVADGADGLVS